MYSFHNTIYLGISKTAKIEDIKKEVNKILKTEVKRSPYKLIPAKWKYYLIIFDLYKVKNSYRDIADTLSSKDDNYYEAHMKKGVQERTIENNHKEALALIEGEYKKYL